MEPRLHISKTGKASLEVAQISVTTNTDSVVLHVRQHGKLTVEILSFEEALNLASTLENGVHYQQRVQEVRDAEQQIDWVAA